ncbi:hypothetical protein HRbin30_00781 [bacterium HR30]|nr:hypothetical protein HRbin30_00781 [bacterium HR30]
MRPYRVAVGFGLKRQRGRSWHYGYTAVRSYIGAAVPLWHTATRAVTATRVHRHAPLLHGWGSG